MSEALAVRLSELGLGVYVQKPKEGPNVPCILKRQFFSKSHLLPPTLCVKVSMWNGVGVG